jgi:hypothetical protein
MSRYENIYYFLALSQSYDVTIAYYHILPPYASLIIAAFFHSEFSVESALFFIFRLRRLPARHCRPLMPSLRHYYDIVYCYFPPPPAAIFPSRYYAAFTATPPISRFVAPYTPRLLMT